MLRLTHVLLIVVGSALLPMTASGKGPAWKPFDFEPLTSLPWDEPKAEVPAILEAIFREPHPGVREAVLGEYLRVIPIEQMGAALEICIDLIGVQAPDRLIHRFLSVWAQRDPAGCWTRVKPLFNLVVTSRGWIELDTWQDRIRVHDRAAVQASRFWLDDRGTLLGFVLGVKDSSWSEVEQAALIRQFSELWRSRFGAKFDPAEANPEMTVSDLPKLWRVFRQRAIELEGYPLPEGSGTTDKLAFEIAMRRWLAVDPGAASRIVDHTSAQRKEYPDGPSNEFLLLWAKKDRPGMLQWVLSSPPRAHGPEYTVKGLLMSGVEAKVRQRWLREAARDRDDHSALLERWAWWDPKPALDAALATNDAETIAEVAYSVVFGAFGSVPNGCSFGLQVMKGFDASRIPQKLRSIVFANWETIMNQWGDNDIGESARYGFDFIRRTGYAPRNELIQLYAGDDQFQTDGDVRDRTFCSLRYWAAVRPDEMKAWIKMIRDPEMRKALTWLLEHPWGGNAAE